MTAAGPHAQPKEKTACPYFDVSHDQGCSLAPPGVVVPEVAVRFCCYWCPRRSALTAGPHAQLAQELRTDAEYLSRLKPAGYAAIVARAREAAAVLGRVEPQGAQATPARDLTRALALLEHADWLLAEDSGMVVCWHEYTWEEVLAGQCVQCCVEHAASLLGRARRGAAVSASGQTGAAE